MAFKALPGQQKQGWQCAEQLADPGWSEWGQWSEQGHHASSLS